MTLDEIITQTMEHGDVLEFFETKSKAKNAKKLALRELKRMRDFLNKADLDAFKVD